MNFLSASTPLKLGFLTVLEEPSGYLGGYLVTNAWGRPLEFRLSTAVQPSRVQQILYGDTMRAYVCADLIGKTLLEKTATAAQIIVTDCQPALDLRQLIEIPVVWLTTSGDRLVPLSLGGRGVRGEGAQEIGEASECAAPEHRHSRGSASRDRRSRSPTADAAPEPVSAWALRPRR